MKKLIIIFATILSFLSFGQTDTIYTKRSGIITGEYLEMDKKYLYIKRSTRPTEKYYPIRKKSVVKIVLSSGQTIYPFAKPPKSSTIESSSEDASNSTKNEWKTDESNPQTQLANESTLELPKKHPTSWMFQLAPQTFPRDFNPRYESNAVTTLSFGVETPINSWLDFQAVFGIPLSSPSYSLDDMPSSFTTENNAQLRPNKVYDDLGLEEFASPGYTGEQLTLTLNPIKRYPSGFGVYGQIGLTTGNLKIHSGSALIKHAHTDTTSGESTYEMVAFINDVTRTLFLGTNLGGGVEYRHKRMTFQLGVSLNKIAYRKTTFEVEVVDREYSYRKEPRQQYNVMSRLQIPFSVLIDF